jgi:hypothetical protein
MTQPQEAKVKFYVLRPTPLTQLAAASSGK